MFLVDTLSARISTDRTPSAGAPIATRKDHGLLPSSPRLKATPPPLGRRRLRLIFWKFHLLPRCSSSTIRLPFFRPISLRFWPSSPVRLRLSSQSRPASSPLGAPPLSEAAGIAACPGGCGAKTAPCGAGAGDCPAEDEGAEPSRWFEVTPVAI